jgi:hypothetical protein
MESRKLVKVKVSLIRKIVENIDNRLGDVGKPTKSCIIVPEPFDELQLFVDFDESLDDERTNKFVYILINDFNNLIYF